MSDYCIVIANGVRARFFTLEPVEFPQLESGPLLCERRELINRERASSHKELYSDSKTGRGRAPRGGRAHGYDDGRSERRVKLEAGFAREVLAMASRMARANQSRRVVIAAPARMLGLLRPHMDFLLKHGVEVRESPKDMIRLNPRQIHELLARERLLPEIRRRGS